MRSTVTGLAGQLLKNRGPAGLVFSPEDLRGGGAYALSHKTEIGADVVFFVAGSDTHYGTGVAVHISRSFEFLKKQSTGR